MVRKMKFALDASGAQSLGSGIGNIFKALAMAPGMRAQAEQDAALNSARIYGANMQGNLAGTKAEQERFTLGQRQVPVDEALPQYLQTAHRLFQMTGDTNALNVARAGSEAQTQGIRDQALAAVDDLDRMNRLNTLAKEGATYMPFDNVGNSGRIFNKATGDGGVLDPVMAKLFDAVQQSAATENFAQANSANASAGNSTASRDMTREKLRVLLDTGKLPGAAGSGEDATNAKTRNAIIAAVEREFPGAPDAEIMTEVAARLARRGIGADKSPVPVSPAGKNRLPSGVTADQALAQARAAINAGKDRAAVLQRLQEWGVDTKGL